MRAAHLRRRQDEVCRERTAQIRAREEACHMHQDEELLFAQLWESDRKAKEKHENQQAWRQRESNFQTLAFLQTQIKAAEQQRLQAKHLKEEEAQLLVKNE